MELVQCLATDVYDLCDRLKILISSNYHTFHDTSPFTIDDIKTQNWGFK